MRRHRLIASTALATTLLAGACALPPPRLDAEEQWGEAISRLGMFPIYPPSEDVMVGDAFLHLPGAPFFDLVRITAAPRGPLAEQFCWQERDRLVTDRSADGASGAVNPRADCDAPQVNGRQHRIAPVEGPVSAEHATRLREAAIPQLAVGRFSEGEVAGAGLIGSVGASLGVGWSSGTAMRLVLTDLQTLTLDELRGSRLLEEIATDRVRRMRQGGARAPRDFPNSLTPLMLARSLQFGDTRGRTQHAQRFCAGDFKALDESGARIVVANRVLYANGITFNFMSESVAAMRLALDVAGALGNPAAAPVVPGLPAVPAAPTPPTPAIGNAPTAAPDLAAQRAALLAAANRLLTLPASTVGRANARIAMGQFGTLALKEDFVRPAAVGMGAGLHLSIADAAVPASPDQIEDVLRYCEAGFGTRSAALQERLQGNLDWVTYLDRRRSGQSAAQAASGLGLRQLDRPRTPLPSFAPSASSRVRL